MKKKISKNVKRGIRYEKEKAKAHGGKHVGGPGKPDYIRGKVRGEVKNTSTKVTKPQLMIYCKKRIREIDSKAGFTKPAIDYRDRYCPGLKLMKKGKKIKKKRK